MTFFKRVIPMIITIILLILSVACGLSSTGSSQNIMTVLAGSELKDIEPFFDQIYDNTGVRLQMSYVGTLDGAEKLLLGEQVDLAWFSHGKYISLLQGSTGRVVAQEKIMLSPVVLGVKESQAQAWGWVNNPDVTWQDIQAKAGAGELQYAMTNPASSNSGFTALIGVASALSGSADMLQAEAIDNQALQEFFKGQSLTAGSSGWLAERYVQEQANLDGLINYESVLLQLNNGGQLQEKLYLVYPKEGIITADYPLMLINGDKREDYQKLVDYLRSPDFQRLLMAQTTRRPAIAQVPLSNQFPDQLLIELPFPNNLDVINELLFAYLDEQRRPSHAFFVLDVSGSMDGVGITDLKAALTNLTGTDESISGQFARFRNREHITFITFSDRVRDTRDFNITEVDSESQSMVDIRNYVNSLEADGGTAIYTALMEAYRLAEEAQQTDPDRFYSIVLMSDGENTDGFSQSTFLDFYAKLSPDYGQRIKTFPILFGNADEAAMQVIAQTTGGRVFDSKSDSLSIVFKQIRGYQ